jgi:hypothetical protein
MISGKKPKKREDLAEFFYDENNEKPSGDQLKIDEDLVDFNDSRN